MGDGSNRPEKTCSLEAVVEDFNAVKAEAEDFNAVEAEAGVGLTERELGIKELDCGPFGRAAEIRLFPLGHVFAELKFANGVQKEIKEPAQGPTAFNFGSVGLRYKPLVKG